jgi:IclR family acetate operon transcriptional repressor
MDTSPILTKEISPPPSPGADRTLSIIELLFDHPAGLTVAEIVRHTGIAHNTANRIAQTLELRGFVQRDDSKRFTVTDRFFGISRPRVDGKSLVAVAYEDMVRLRDTTGESVQILARCDWKAVVLEQLPGHHPVTVLGKIGMRIPIYSCAPGKAILANLPDRDLDRFFAEVELKQFTATTLATQHALTAGLLEARHKGYAVDRSEGLEGIQCVAAPILDKHGYPIAGITVIGPSFRLVEDEFVELGKHCIEAARNIQRRL